MSDRLRRALPALVALAVFIAALEILRHELATTSWAAVALDLQSTSSPQLAAALLLTVLNYAVLTTYDLLAFASIGRRLAPWRIGVASFLAYAVANNVGFAMLSGASIRYRFYSRWGLGAEELSQIILSYSITFWLGLLALGGLSLAMGPLSGTHTWAAALAAPAGWLLFSLSVLFVVSAGVRKTPVRLWRMEFRLPPLRIALAQWVASSADWLLAASVFYVLLPEHAAPFAAVVGAFLAAQLLGLLSHLPGGAGVFEGLIVVLLRPYLASAELIGPLLLYGAVYYLLPFAVAVTALILDETLQRRAGAARTAALIGRMAEQLTPRALAALTFVSGVVLLFSGATPAAAGRLEWLTPIRSIWFGFLLLNQNI